MNNIYRIIAVSIYPLLLLFTFFTIWRKDKYKNTIIKNIKPILINTAFITILFSAFIFFFLNNEHTIYSWDYSGHWIRSLTLRNIFFSNPQNIFQEVYKSMNYSDYSYLPALFTLPFTIINISFPCFCVGNFISFFIPLFIIIQIAYFTYFDKYKYLPSLIFIIFYPLYYPILEGKSCGCGLIFIAASYLLLFLQDINEIDLIDSLSINLFMYTAIFERRWYLYSALVLYLSLLVKYFVSFKSINNKLSFFITRIVFSGLFLLLAALIFNTPFFIKALTNNYSDIYTTYNRSGKLLNFINYYSIITCIIVVLGFIFLYRKNKLLFFINIISLIVSTILFWNVQSFETHHYYISMINMVIPFITGFYFILENLNRINIVVASLLVIQALLVFVDIKPVPIFTKTKRTSQYMDNIEDYKNLCIYMKNLLGKDDSAFICGSSNTLNDDIIRNSQLPDLEMPSFEYAQVDLVDGFPNNMDCIRYILIPKPFQYYDKNSQHVQEIIANAIENDSEFKEVYKLLDVYKFGDITINIYEKQGALTPKMKQYLYDQIIEYYPNNTDIFKEILE